MLFERTTFLIIARSGGDESMPEFDSDSDDGVGHLSEDGEGSEDDSLNPKRFEKISELVKAFKISCRYLEAVNLFHLETDLPFPVVNYRNSSTPLKSSIPTTPPSSISSLLIPTFSLSSLTPTSVSWHSCYLSLCRLLMAVIQRAPHCG